MKAFIGECVGTFLLVFIGLATVVNAVIIGSYAGLMQVALLWGMAVTIAVSITGPISGAHLNPAITLAFASTTDFSWKKVPSYILAQCIGSFLAALIVYQTYGGAISDYENAHEIIRGTPESIRSAMVFGEFFPNPADSVNNPALEHSDWKAAFMAEFLGTFILAFVIFSIIKMKSLPGWLIPILIGITLTILISLFAPLSQAGFNPARDLMPRLFSSLAGWGNTPFTETGHGWLTVYILAPVIGAGVGAWMAKLFKCDE